MFILGFICGVAASVIGGYFVWRNNKAKWSKIIDLLQLTIATDENIDLLKKKIQDIIANFKK